MTTTAQNRRTMLKLGLGLAGTAALGLPASAQEKKMRMFWWGSKDRADRTFKANELYQKANPGTSIEGETLGWNDYWPKLATQTAGRNAPDVVQMDYRYLFEYARRGALMPLDGMMPKTLNIADFGQAQIDSGRVDGKTYAVSLGLNSTALLYDKALLDQLGVVVPKHTTTWEEMGKLGSAISKAANREGYRGVMDAGGMEQALEVWVRQRGKALYTEDGKLAFDEKDVAEWFAFWDGLRKMGAIVMPDVQALDKDSIETSVLTLGKAAITFANSNQLVGFQAVNKSKLGMSMLPVGGAGTKPGQYLKPAMLWSVSARAKDPEEAAKIVNFFVTNPEAAQVLGVERGVPPSAAMRALLASQLDALGKEMVDYVSFATDKVGALPPPPPKGAGEIFTVLRRTNEQVGFGKLTVADAAKSFIAEANSIIARG